jgi:hypothetical protein
LKQASEENNKRKKMCFRKIKSISIGKGSRGEKRQKEEKRHMVEEGNSCGRDDNATLQQWRENEKIKFKSCKRC